MRDDYLEILNIENQVFSRFRFDANGVVFHHTNDEDTLSIKGQYIELSEFFHEKHAHLPNI